MSLSSRGRAVNRWFGILLFGVSLMLIGCKSAGPARTPSGQPSPGAAAPPAAPNPAPPQPAPIVMPPPAPVPASVPPSASTAEPSAVTPAAAPAPPARPYQDILKLKQAGLSDEFLMNKVRTENVPYQLATPEIVELRNAGVSETVVQAMMRSGQPPAATSGMEVARKAEFSGFARVGKGFLGLGTSAKKVGRLVVDGENVSWFDSEDPKKNFSIYARNIKEVFNTCVLRPTQNLCLEFGFVTHTGEEYRFRDPGWKNGDNKLVSDATTYFRQAFPTLFFSQRAVNEM
jgi:hypothetical protein